MQSGCGVRPSVSVRFEETKAAAMLATTGRVLVYAYETDTACGCGWVRAKGKKTRLAATLKHAKAQGGEVRMEEVDLDEVDV